MKEKKLLNTLLYQNKFDTVKSTKDCILGNNKLFKTNYMFTDHVISNKYFT